MEWTTEEKFNQSGFRVEEGTFATAKQLPRA